MTWAPWEVVNHWSPFHIDALGLVTLLGAEEVNGAVGRLVRSAYLEYLPILGAFVIAGNQITSKAAGFNLYNISQGIHTTDLSAWLTRWMLSQDFEATRSFVVWTVTPPKSRRNDIIISFIISFIFNGFLVALTVLSRDWYGFANALAMDISIIVRVYVVGQQRAAVDARVDEAVKNAKLAPPEGTYEAARVKWLHELDARKLQKEEKKEPKRRRRSFASNGDMNGGILGRDNVSTQDFASSKRPKQRTRLMDSDTMPQRPKFEPKKFEDPDYAWTGQSTKVLIIQTDSKAVTFWMPNELLAPPSLFIEGPKVLHPQTYFAVRSIGWLAFAVHIVAIGMADLVSQLYTVVLIVLPTLLLVLKFSCDDSELVQTFQRWRRSFLSGSDIEESKQHKQADEDAPAAEPVKLRQCWIGSRLKAEIYEWPHSYEFTQGKESIWTSGPLDPGKERSRKRQDLYAWLALSQDEEESMDKWDLFPHIRDDNTGWWETYKRKKNCLKPNEHFGPQLERALAPGKKDHEVFPKSIFLKGRTDTKNFVSDASDRRHVQVHKESSVVTNSSAFPAISDHDQAQIITDEGGAAITQSPVEATAASRPSSVNAGAAPSEITSGVGRSDDGFKED
ncbi:hypothetical protein H2202_001264 [Exophiala xenobiotica]|nr:hypothetical protein H2202_001264 [Exophiala xenobiotica]KAK5208915.1 hypothetical protein LTR41_005312 [Exophiala xenobiotica]KAK5221158.1 hypothetical protein LTR72_006718 [Exophiala xenobiotica]KAK5229212.1 hypothetical protein LTR47_007814 [Exophiala xenobiotica]KAK5248246.1 hypothetical protein LTS06_006678 [Exophiala xenobiotica]